MARLPVMGCVPSIRGPLLKRAPGCIGCVKASITFTQTMWHVALIKKHRFIRLFDNYNLWQVCGISIKDCGIYGR